MMIVSFSLENWMSFQGPVTFSMVASKERQHKERLPKVDKYRTKILPITAIYGGNASGKTNLFKAFSFAKSLVVKGTRPDDPIVVKPFRLDAEAAHRPSRFIFELLIDETMYEFSFAATRRAILEEKLVEITSTSEKVLYDRRNGEPNFHNALAKDKLLPVIFQGTQDNQLFLTNSIFQKIDKFRPVYDWFENTLQLIAPDARFGGSDIFLDEKYPLNDAANELLSKLDTGIVRLGSEKIPLDNPIFPAPIMEKIRDGDISELSVDDSIVGRIEITFEDGEAVIRRLVTYHPKPDGTEVKFGLHEESDGSRRVIDLLPAFLMLSGQELKKVFIIDEIDRSLHTLLTRELLEMYLDTCSPKTRSQLLIATHDVLLMDQDLLRRDEMWMAERNSSGASTLYSFNDFKDIRRDNNVLKSYLQGRLGGVPRIMHENIFTDVASAE